MLLGVGVSINDIRYFVFLLQYPSLFITVTLFQGLILEIIVVVIGFIVAHSVCFGITISLLISHLSGWNQRPNLKYRKATHFVSGTLPTLVFLSFLGFVPHKNLTSYILVIPLVKVAYLSLRIKVKKHPGERAKLLEKYVVANIQGEDV